VIPAFPVYLFDVDGTLLDSAADICGAVSQVLATTSADGVPDSVLRRYIGRHLYDLFHDVIPGVSQTEMEDLLQRYRTNYLAREHRSTKPYPGVADTLRHLGGRKSTATTKGTPTTRIVLEKFGLLDYFDHVQGTDGFPSKPAPDVVWRSLAGLGARPEDCLLVGDSAPDMEAGRRAGVKICAVTYGYGNPEELARWEPDYRISDLRELVG
jgi:HAD superfamily hydrolase (TIGR01509 family)